MSRAAKDLESAQQTLNANRQEALQVIDAKTKEIETLKRSISEEQDMESQLSYLQGKLEELKYAKARLDQELQVKNTAFDEAMEQFATKEAAMQRRIRNLETDLKTSFNNHKKSLSDLEEQYKHENYKVRYAAIISENQDLWGRISETNSLLDEMNEMSKMQQETNRQLALNVQTVQQSNAPPPK